MTAADEHARPLAMLNSLTGLRFLAAMHVVFVHLLVINHLPPDTPGVFLEIATRGYMAVPLFFVLSGFVLTYTYTGRLSSVPNGGINRREFWAARFARIYPVYALSLLLAIPTFFTRDTLIHPLSAVGVVVPVALMIQAWFPLIAQAWLSPAWSLSAEAFFYLVFPFVIRRIVGAGPRRLLAALPLVWIASITLPVIWLIISPNTDGEVGSVHWQWAMSIYFGPLPHLPEFLAGVVLGRIFLSQRARGFASGLAGTRTVGFVAVLALAGYVFAAYAGGGDLPRILSHTGIFLPIYAVLVYSLALGGGALGRVLSTRPMLLLGEASYGLYLLHFPAFWFTERVIRRSPWMDAIFASGWMFPCIEVLVAVGLSVVVYLMVERPARRFIRQLLTRKVTAVAAAATEIGAAAAGVRIATSS